MTQKNKNILPQAEPYIVKSHDFHIDADYADCRLNSGYTSFWS